MNLATWFDGLTAAKVEKMLGEPETQYLDCKRAGEDGKIKEALATLTSAFANASGGVCLWGVDARKANEVDCICAFPGVANPRALASRLDELSAMATTPGVVGVRHRALVRKAGPQFVASFVPPSDIGPHMAGYGLNRYYLRLTTSSSPMPHSMVADMFGRRPQGQLEVKPIAYGAVPYGAQMEMVNVGRGPVIAPFLQLSVEGPFSRNQMGVDGNRGEHLPIVQMSGGRWLHSGGMDTVLHPTMSLRFGGTSVGHYYVGPPPPACRVHYKAGGAYIQPIEGVLDFCFW